MNIPYANGGLDVGTFDMMVSSPGERKEEQNREKTKMERKREEKGKGRKRGRGKMGGWMLVLFG